MCRMRADVTDIARISGERPVDAGAIDVALHPHGLVTRGVVRFVADDGPELPGGGRAKTVVLVGHAGAGFWPAFAGWRDRQADRGGADPLDTWSKCVIDAVAADFAAAAYYPSDPPYQPFQRWAIAAEGLGASPLGILIHPGFGLWHGYRGALGFSGYPVRGVAVKPETSPCVKCLSKPCVSHCPANALDNGSYDADRCRAYLATPAGQGGCVTTGCVARAACPVGSSYRYGQEQVRFHMKALQVMLGDG